MKRPTVLHLTTVDMSLALLLLPQLVGLRDEGFEVWGVSSPGPYVQMLEEHGIRHFPMPSSTRAMSLRADVRAAKDLARICRAARPDILHTHNPKPGVFGRIVGRVVGVPIVVNTVHGLYAQPTDPFVRRAVVYGLERAASSFSDAELLQNVEDVDVLRRLRVPERKLVLLGNGIDLRRFDVDRDTAARGELRAELGIAPTEIVVGLVGRLVAEKGYAEAFAAARIVREHAPDVRFVVVGPEDPDKPDAVTDAQMRRARADGVMFLGERADVDRLYRAMDVFVLASHREGFPRAAMEAAAMSLPIVATDIRGCRQVVEDGRTGRLVPPRDPAALAAAILALVRDEDTRSAFGRAGREKALREFDHRRQVDITAGVYRRLLKGAP